MPISPNLSGVVVDDRSPLANFRQQLVDDVCRGLTAEQKELPPKYFYDERGSMLFEKIMELDEYYPTRTEHALLDLIAGDLAERVRPRALLELGSGNSAKTRRLIEEFHAGGLRHYVPLDISREILLKTAHELRGEYSDLEIRCIIGDFAEDLPIEHLPEPALIIFLGGTIGNFHRPDALRLLGNIAGRMRPGDRFLLGADLVKDPNLLHAAYNDAAGVTAAFNLNVLDVLNRELDARFDPQTFAHYAFYNPRQQRIEMHLASLRVQTVKIDALELEAEFYMGETILTEVSRKFTRRRLSTLLAEAGMELEELFSDNDNRFALALARRADTNANLQP